MFQATVPARLTAQKTWTLMSETNNFGIGRLDAIKALYQSAAEKLKAAELFLTSLQILPTERAAIKENTRQVHSCVWTDDAQRLRSSLDTQRAVVLCTLRRVHFSAAGTDLTAPLARHILLLLCGQVSHLTHVICNYADKKPHSTKALLHNARIGTSSALPSAS